MNWFIGLRYVIFFLLLFVSVRSSSNNSRSRSDLHTAHSSHFSLNFFIHSSVGYRMETGCLCLVVLNDHHSAHRIFEWWFSVCFCFWLLLLLLLLLFCCKLNHFHPTYLPPCGISSINSQLKKKERRCAPSVALRWCRELPIRYLRYPA